MKMKIFHSRSPPPPTPGKICAICELGNFAIVCSGKMEEIFFLGNKFSLDNEFFLFYFIFQDFLKMIFTGLLVLFYLYWYWYCFIGTRYIKL